MKTLKILIAAVAIAAVTRPALPNVLPQAEVNVISTSAYADRDDDDQKETKAEREESMYDAASDMLDEREWRRAAATFDRVAQLHMSHADAALYWLAYAQNKMGQRSEALGTLISLQKSYPKSRWVEDGKALEVEIRQSSGQHIDAGKVDDEDLKLMALSGLMSNDAERAVPILETILAGKSSPKVKDRALFVLSQSSSSKALEILARTAKSG